MNGMPLLLLVIFSAFTMNLTLQCGLGLKGAAEFNSSYKRIILIKLGVIFTAVILLWLLFSRVIFPLFSGFFVYVLLFPVSYIIYDWFEYIVFGHILKRKTEEKDCVSFPGGITAVAVFICLNITDNLTEAVLLSFGFTSGIFLVFMVIGEIRKRAALEAVPRFLRGKPLVLIAMGMLSLVFSTASLLILRMMALR